jgi:hypothetical protein
MSAMGHQPGPHTEPRRRAERELAVSAVELSRLSSQAIEILSIDDPVACESGYMWIVLIG